MKDEKEDQSPLINMAKEFLLATAVINADNRRTNKPLLNENDLFCFLEFHGVDIDDLREL